MKAKKAVSKKVCSRCKKETEKLVGLFVPHLCEPCLEQVRVEQRATGQVCTLCRKPYCDCYC